jgi:hypothetical protein
MLCLLVREHKKDLTEQDKLRLEYICDEMFFDLTNRHSAVLCHVSFTTFIANVALRMLPSLAIVGYFIGDVALLYFVGFDKYGNSCSLTATCPLCLTLATTFFLFPPLLAQVLRLEGRPHNERARSDRKGIDVRG